MARVFADENFPLPTVEALRGLAHDVLTMQQTGQADRGVPDGEVLRLATTEQRILITLNRRHFIRLHDEQPQHAGIIVCTFDRNYVGLAERIDDVLRTHPTLAGMLLRVNRPAS